MTGGTVAVMQPYFHPYAGYFRLLAVADTFVVFDDAQFPRRGRVHRCQVPGPSGAVEWLTLPLARAPRDTRILDLRFAPAARAAFDRRLARLPWLATARGPWAERIRAHLGGRLRDVLGFLEEGLALVAEALDLHPRIVRSSSLGLDPGLRGQDRVLAIARALEAGTYVNAPGGRALYTAEAFRRAGLDLRFLVPYEGPGTSVLPALAAGAVAALRRDVRAAARLAEAGSG